MNELKKNKYIATKTLTEIVKDVGINVSKNTIINRLHQNNFIYGIATKKPLLSNSHKENRLEWAKKNINTNWSEIIFSDEASIWKSLSNYRWIDNNINDYDKVVKHPLKKHVWGCINKQKINKLYIFNEIMNAKLYEKILIANIKEHFDPISKNKLMFQDDNDPKHRSKLITKWKEENNINSFMWPSCSPDLSPIENVWGIVKNKISKINIQTAEEFELTIAKCWLEIDQKIIDNIIDSMPNRIIKLIEANGDVINY